MSTTKPRLILRADGDERIGLGHVMRLVAFAEIMGDVFTYEFAIQQPSAAVRAVLESVGLSILMLPKQPYSTEPAWLAESLLEDPTRIIVLDGYEFDDSYQDALKRFGYRLVAVDDLRAWPVVADILINHSPGVTPTMYAAADSTAFFIGPTFSLVRRPFLAVAHPPTPPKVIERVLLCFGGADPAGLTARSLRALASVPHLTGVGVLTGSSFNDKDALRAAMAATSHLQLRRYDRLGSDEIVELFGCYDAIICPASTMLIEALLLGRAVVTGYFVENQRHLADFVHDHQQAYSVGNFIALSDEQLARALGRGFGWLTTSPRRAYAPELYHQDLRAAVLKLATAT